jgi:hypothetical protein
MPLIHINLKQSTLKPWHAEMMKEIYEWLLTGQGKKIYLWGWRSAGIIECLGWQDSIPQPIKF